MRIERKVVCEEARMKGKYLCTQVNDLCQIVYQEKGLINLNLI